MSTDPKIVYQTGCYDQLVTDVGDLVAATFGLGIFFAILTVGE